MKLFRNLKRVVSQFVETEYWYRFRNKKTTYINGYGKKRTEKIYNGYILANTWDGTWAISKYLDIKLSHMIHNLYKWSDESSSYIDGGAVVAYGNKKDQLRIWDRSVERLQNYCFFDKELDIGDSVFSYDCSKDTYDKKAIKKGAKLKIAGMTIRWEDDVRYRLAFIYSFDGCKKRSSWYLIKQSKEEVDDAADDTVVETLKLIPMIEKSPNEFKKCQFIPIKSPLWETIKEKIPEWEFSDFAFAQHTFNVDITEYKDFSKGFINHTRGAIKKVRSIWTFRKMLRDYFKFETEIMDNSDIYDKIKDDTDLAARYKAFDEVTKKEIYDKCFEKLKDIARYYVDNSGSWWD